MFSTNLAVFLLKIELCQLNKFAQARTGKQHILDKKNLPKEGHVLCLKNLWSFLPTVPLTLLLESSA